VFAAGLHYAHALGWFRVKRSVSTLLLAYKTKVIGLINEVINGTTKCHPDALIVSILIMAAHGPKIGSPYFAGRIYPIPPLANI
jgi:hypothetical protein